MAIVHFACKRRRSNETFYPNTSDLIIVDVSEWYALKDGERLRVCEPIEWMEIGEEIHVLPRHQASTFWGPSYGEPDGYKPMHMSTSGGPFKTLKIKELKGLTLVEETEDTFWHWQDTPRASGAWNTRSKLLYGDYRSCQMNTTESFASMVLRRIATVLKRKAGRGTNGHSFAFSNDTLGCIHCDRQDFDGISDIPTEWHNVFQCHEWNESENAQALRQHGKPIVVSAQIALPCTLATKHRLRLKRRLMTSNLSYELSTRFIQSSARSSIETVTLASPTRQSLSTLSRSSKAVTKVSARWTQQAAECLSKAASCSMPTTGASTLR